MVSRADKGLLPSQRYRDGIRRVDIQVHTRRQTQRRLSIQHCRHRLKHRKRPIGAGVRNIPDRGSIRERPPEVEKREEFGHFEMDLIQNGKDFILTIIERKTGFLIMERLTRGKNAEVVAKTVIRLLKPLKKHVKSITTDNGGEFAKHKLIAKKLHTSVYFTDPYSSWQKGTVENTNKLIR